MATLSPTASRSGLGRILRSVAALFAGLLVTTCADNPTSPNRPGFGAVQVQPAFDQYAIFAPLVLNQVRVVVVRPPLDTVIDSTRAFSVTQQQLSLSLPVTLQSSSELMDVTLQLSASGVLLFSGTEQVEVRQGRATPSTSIPVSYSGPGAGATSIGLAPRDTTIRVGATLPMRATAFDDEGVDIGQFYLGWSLLNAGTGATIDATGLLHAPASAGTLIVRGITPNGLRDSVTVTIVPAPALLAKSSGDNQTGTPGQPLAARLAVLVTGAGNIPVPGVAVTFAATTGGGTVDSATATTNAQGIAQSGVTLGQTVGAQTFTASATGLTSVVFTATAQGVTIQPAPRLIASGLEHTCELRSGVPFCWGGNSEGQLGDNNGEFNIGVAVPVQGGQTFTSITAGELHTCGLTAAGQVFCWGLNDQGQLGDGSTTNRPLPTLVTGGRTYVQLEASSYGNCALTAAGEAYCWGSNQGGQIGDGTSANNRLVPTAVSGGHTFKRLAGGEEFYCALTPAGAAFCWGQNGFGQLGDGSTTGRTAPVAVGGGLVFTDIGAGYQTSCALTAAGAGFCWGNFFNQTLTAPQAIGGGPFASFSTGGNHVCAVTAAGAAFCGGDNSNGQLGDGNAPTDSPTPVAVSGGLVFTELGAGSLHTCGRTSTATYCWGRGNAGQAGDGGYTQRNTPVQVRGPAVSTGVNDGNAQTALPGAAVAIPPSVIVRNQQGQPLQGVRVAFAVTAGGGSITLPTQFTDANGVARVGSWTLGASAGANSLTATATYPALTGNPVSFTATGGAPPTFRTWTGAVSADWSNPGNWSGGGVPSAGDSAVIVAATLTPQLTATTVVGAVTISSGALVVNGQGLSILRNLTVTGGGGLVMTNQNDLVTVGGNATFNGASSAGQLTAGTLSIAGNLTQLSSTSPFSFAAGGSHITLFTTGAHTISFASPGAPSGSGFADVEFAGNGTTTLATATWVRGTLDVNAAGQVFTSTNGSRLGVERLVATAPVTFNNVPLVINQTQQTSITNQPLTFQNMATNVVQLEINHPGSSSPLTLAGFVFSTVPVAPNGFYLDVNDNLADANPLVINMTGATPTAGTPFVRTSGGAAVNWPVAGTLRTWNGSVNSDWTITNNWDGGIVPQPGDDVLIPEDAVNDPLFAGSIMLRNLTLESESGETVLTVNGDGGIAVTGNLFAHGQILGTATISLAGAGPHQLTAEAISSLNVDGNTTVVGDLGIERALQINSGVFDFRDRSITVGGAFRTLNAGTIQMNSGSFLVIGGEAVFSGASTAGLIAGGGISVAGDFTAAAADGSFAPGNGNSVTLNGVDDQTVTLGSTASFFENLAFSKPSGNVVLGSDVTVFQTMGGGFAPGLGVLGAHTMTVGLINAGNVIFNGARLVWNSLTADPPFSFSNFTFENYSAATPQFTINHPGIPGNTIDLDGITFFSTPSPFHLLVNDNANDGVPLVVNLTNVTPANGAGLFQVTNGATVNWPAVTTNWVWTGAVSTNWNAAGNWDRASIPPANADVAIGAAPNQPTLTADVSVNSVLVSTAGARLTLGGHSLTVAGNFTTHTDGLLVSTNPADRLIVGAQAAFQGGDETGLITAGELRLNGSFIQQVQTSPFSFLASGSHRTIMTNASQLQSVQFCCTANTSKFMNLDISNSFGINIQFASNGVFVADTLIVQPGAGPRPWLYMLGSPLTARRFKINRLLVDRGTLTLNEAGVAGTQQLDSVTFQNYQTTQTQLAVVAPGTRTLTFNNLVFQALSAGNTGRYVNATASTGTLTLDLTTANVTNGPGFTTINGSAIVNWPVPTASTWTGTASTAWADPANWSAGVPGSTTTVTIPAGTPFAPTAGAVSGTSAGNLTVATGATLTLVSPFNLTVFGNVDAQGTIGPISQGLTLSGTNITLRGNVPQLTATGIVTLNGNTTASSNGPCVFNGSAELIVNGFTFSCFQLAFNNTARIQMTNPADSVVALGPAQFFGGSTLGRLTAGVLDLRGSFQQTGTNSPASFASTGTRVRASGTGASSWSMGTGGPGQSQFRTVLISRTGGTMTMSGALVYVTDSMIVSSAIPISIPGTLNPNKLRLAAGAGLTGAGSIQIIGDSLFVTTPANYTIGSTVLYGPGSGNQQIPALPYPSLTLDNSTTHTLVGRTATTGPVFVVNGTLVLGGRTLSTAAGFQVQPGGQVRMTNALDSLLVGGNAFFQSTVDGTGNLTTGVLRVAQNMTVDGSVTGFAPSGTHKTILASVLASNVNWTGLGTTPIQFQNLEANANLLSINYARVNGTMTVTGTGGINVSTLNVRGQLTTASTAGMGIDSLYLGAAVPIAPGSGRVAANVYILDNGGTQSIPTLPVPTAGGADSAALVIRSNIAVPSTLILKGLRVDGSGQLDINGQTVNVNGEFWTADNGTIVMDDAADRLNITGAVTFAGGSESSLLTDGILTSSGRFTQDNTNSISSFAAVGNHLTRFTSNHPDGNIVFFATPQSSAFMNLETTVPLTFSSNVLIFNDFTNSATGTTTAQRVAVQGDYTQNGNVTFTPSRFVFYGTLSTGINVTAGSFRPDTIQFNDGLVPVVPVNANIVYGAAEVTGAGTVVTLGATAPTWTSLLISGTAQLSLNGRALNVAGPLIGNSGTVLGTGSVQARRLQITGLTVDNARLILDEQGTTQAQSVSGLTFQNLATPGGTGLFTVTAVGNNGTPRALPLGINFNTTVAGGQRYLTLASSNSQTLNANVTSNLSGAAVTAAGAASPTIGSTVNGATITWP